MDPGTCFFAGVAEQCGHWTVVASRLDSNKLHAQWLTLRLAL